MNEINQIYDKAFKRILTLSDKTVINLINGLFDTNYPTDSKITYNWTEHTDKDLKRTLADSILTINGRDSYHIEAQMTEDEEIVFRFIEYGFGYAYKNRTFVNGGERMVFPRPYILYLDEGKKDTIPDEYTLTLLFENQGEFSYKVPLVKLQNMSIKELNEKKMIALLPFQLLKLRKKIDNLRTEENLKELQEFVINDIIDSIYKNEVVGNISYNDAMDLIELTTKLYMKIYSKYKELEDFTMRMCDQSLDFISDKYEQRLEDLENKRTELENKTTELENKRTELENKATELENKKAILESKTMELESKNEELQDKNEELQDKNEELQDKNEELQKIIKDLEHRLEEAQTK